MELERSLDKLKQQGLGVAAISYDSPELLHYFAQRMGGLHYPLLADPDSRIIRVFGILNTNIPKGHEWYGVCFPGTYIVDENGIVRSKYFEPMHRQRFTADTILVKEYGVGGGKHQEIRTEHLRLTAYASQDTARPGNRISLVFELQMPPKMHVYAPGVKGYRPVAVRIEENLRLKGHPTQFPRPEMLRLEAIQETLPVYEGRVRILQDLTLSPRLGESKLTIPITFSYQACDDRICYPPASIPIELEIALEAHDGERAPEHLRHKEKK